MSARGGYFKSALRLILTAHVGKIKFAGICRKVNASRIKFFGNKSAFTLKVINKLPYGFDSVNLDALNNGCLSPVIVRNEKLTHTAFLCANRH